MGTNVWVLTYGYSRMGTHVWVLTYGYSRLNAVSDRKIRVTYGLYTGYIRLHTVITVITIITVTYGYIQPYTISIIRLQFMDGISHLHDLLIHHMVPSLLGLGLG